MPKEARRKNSKLFIVQTIEDVRSNRADGKREYLTRWRGYKTPSWNCEDDFPASFFEMLLMQDFLAIVDQRTEVEEAANLLLGLKK